MDGGKPIKESRDVDLPLAAAHFFYYAGWADKLEYAFPGAKIRRLGVAGQVIPWNFPLLMAAWKLAPALAAGNTCVLKPAETTPLTCLLLAKIIEEADLPPGVVNIVTGAGATGAALVRHKDVDKDRLYGARPRWASGSRNRSPGTEKKLTLELGGKAANILFADAPIDQAIEGIISAIYFNQGHVCCAGSRLLVEESVHDIVVRKLMDRMATLRVGDPLDKKHRCRRHQLEDAAREDPASSCASGEKEGPSGFSAALRPAFARVLVRAHGLHGRLAVAPHRPRGDLRAGPLGAHVPDARGGHREGQQHDVRPLGGRLDGQGSKSFWMAQRLRAGVVWANTFNKFDPSSPVRWLQRERLRPRGRAAGPARLPRGGVTMTAKKKAA
jgi:aldehyde dehydrogenase (NAD+)